MIARTTSCSTGTKDIQSYSHLYAPRLLTRKYCDANDNITARQGRSFSDSSDVTRASRAYVLLANTRFFFHYNYMKKLRN